MLSRNQICQIVWKPFHSDVKHRSANRQTPFWDGVMSALHAKRPFQGRSPKSFDGQPTILRLDIECLTASKRIIQQHLAELEALVILLQDTQCTTAERLVIANYTIAWFSLSKKYSFATFVHATFVHERLNRILCSQSPSTLDTEWLYEDVEGYKIINIHKLPSTRLQAYKLLVFSCPSLYAVDFNSSHTDWKFNIKNADGECVAAWEVLTL